MCVCVRARARACASVASLWLDATVALQRHKYTAAVDDRWQPYWAEDVVVQRCSHSLLQ